MPTVVPEDRDALRSISNDQHRIVLANVSAVGLERIEPLVIATEDRPSVAVAVIIPAYNVERNIGETLDAVFSQTVRPAEVIVVDDGSTDQTANIARRKGAVVYVQQNGGVSAARNRGASLASSPWLAYLDGDDIWAPDKLERQFQAAATDSKAGIVFTDFWQFDPQGCINKSVIHEIHQSFRSVARTEIAPKVWRCDSIELCELIPRAFVMLPSTLLVRRDLVLAVGGWDESISFSEDIEIALRLLSRTSALFVDIPLVGYRRHSSNVTTNRLRMRAGDIKVLERVSRKPASYFPATVAWFDRERPSILLKAGRMAVVYGEHELGRRWLRESFALSRRASALFWIAVSMLTNNSLGRRTMAFIEQAWFALRTFRTRTR